MRWIKENWFKILASVLLVWVTFFWTYTKIKDNDRLIEISFISVCAELGEQDAADCAKNIFRSNYFSRFRYPQLFK